MRGSAELEDDASGSAGSSLGFRVQGLGFRVQVSASLYLSIVEQSLVCSFDHQSLKAGGMFQGQILTAGTAMIRGLGQPSRSRAVLRFLNMCKTQ